MDMFCVLSNHSRGNVVFEYLALATSEQLRLFSLSAVLSREVDCGVGCVGAANLRSL